MTASLQHGGSISQGVEVSHISSHGFWLLAGDAELFLPFEDFPWFKDAPVGKVLNVQEPSLDIFIGPIWTSTSRGDHRQPRQISAARPAIAAFHPYASSRRPSRLRRSPGGSSVRLSPLTMAAMMVPSGPRQDGRCAAVPGPPSGNARRRGRGSN